jgi:hypothetical protein
MLISGWCVEMGKNVAYLLGAILLFVMIMFIFFNTATTVATPTGFAIAEGEAQYSYTSLTW